MGRHSITDRGSAPSVPLENPLLPRNSRSRGHPGRSSAIKRRVPPVRDVNPPRRQQKVPRGEHQRAALERAQRLASHSRPHPREAAARQDHDHEAPGLVGPRRCNPPVPCGPPPALAVPATGITSVLLESNFATPYREIIGSEFEGVTELDQHIEATSSIRSVSLSRVSRHAIRFLNDDESASLVAMHRNCCG